MAGPDLKPNAFKMPAVRLACGSGDGGIAVLREHPRELGEPILVKFFVSRDAPVVIGLGGIIKRHSEPKISVRGIYRDLGPLSKRHSNPAVCAYF